MKKDNTDVCKKCGRTLKDHLTSFNYCPDIKNVFAASPAPEVAATSDHVCKKCGKSRGSHIVLKQVRSEVGFCNVYVVDTTEFEPVSGVAAPTGGSEIEQFYWVCDAPDCFFIREHGSSISFMAKCARKSDAEQITNALNASEELRALINSTEKEFIKLKGWENEDSIPPINIVVETRILIKNHNKLDGELAALKALLREANDIIHDYNTYLGANIIHPQPEKLMSEITAALGEKTATKD